MMFLLVVDIEATGASVQSTRFILASETPLPAIVVKLWWEIHNILLSLQRVQLLRTC